MLVAAVPVRLWKTIARALLTGALLATLPCTAAVFNFNPPPGSGLTTGTIFPNVVRLSFGGQNLMDVSTPAPNDLTSANGVVAWSSGSTIYSYVFDQTRGRWIGSTTTQGPTFDLSTADGVVAWSTTSGVFFRVYDPRVGNWVSGGGNGRIAEARLLNAGGVVAWSLSTPANPAHSVNFSVYDPTVGGGTWRSGGVATTGSTHDLQTADGIVAWSVNSLIAYQVYNPAAGEWRGGSAGNGPTTDLAIQNSLVSWTSGASTPNNRGYNGPAGSWSNSPTALAWFAVSSNAGNAPLSVSFIDMSIGGSSWSWNFGDSQGTSTRRSPIYQYTAFGRFNATLTVNSSISSRSILTDITPPVGTNRINNGAGFTTNSIVTLTLSASDNSGVVASNRFSNDGVTWSAWEPFAASKTWMLSANNGEKIVSAQFTDRAGNTSATANASIYLDTTALPVVSLVNANVSESGGVATVLAVLDHPYSQPVSVSFATANGTALSGSDYLATNGVLRFASNVTTASFSVPIIADGQTEVNETILVLFSNATNGIAGPPGTITIVDDDSAVVTFAATNFSAIEGSGAASITVALSAPSGLPVTVHYAATNGVAIPGTDFTPVEGMLFFEPGQTNQTFVVPLINESLDELSETIELKLFDATNAFIGVPFEATLTILDDDKPLVFFSQSTFPVAENSGVALVQVWLSKPFNLRVEVDYTAFGGTATPGFPGDYFATSGRLVFAENNTNQSFFVNLVNDNDPELVETIRVTLNTNNIVNASAGARTEAEIAITDDDGPPLMLSPTVTVGRQFQVTFQGKPGQRFFVEASTNLPVWFPLATLTNTTGTLPYIDPTPATGPRRFYRSLVTP